MNTVFQIWLAGAFFNTLLYFSDPLIYWSKLKSLAKVREVWKFDLHMLAMGVILSWLLFPVVFLYKMFKK